MAILTKTRETNGKTSKAELDALEPVSNDAEEAISFGQPYIASVTVEGAAAFLFHRWSNESIAEKAASAKGSKAKKTDDLESYVYRLPTGEYRFPSTGEKFDRTMPNGDLAIPGEYFRMSIIGAAKFRQDPRSPRKSAMDLFKAGISVLDDLCTLGTPDWDYIDQRRVMIQRNGITRARPAMLKGWTCEVTLQVLLPEYISPAMLNETIQQAGRLIGVGDFRPTFGRFLVTGFKTIDG